jgi:hypothetical protein
MMKSEETQGKWRQMWHEERARRLQLQEELTRHAKLHHSLIEEWNRRIEECKSIRNHYKDALGDKDPLFIVVDSGMRAQITTYNNCIRALRKITKTDNKTDLST